MQERVEIHVQVRPPGGRHRRPRTPVLRRVVDTVARWLRLSDEGAAAVTGILIYGAASVAVAIITALPLA